MGETVRALSLDDYERWISVWRRAGLHSVRLQGRDSRAAFERQLATGTHTMIGLELNGDLAGVVLVTHDGRKGWINRLAVVPEYRGQGYGKRLVSEAERALQAQGMTVIAVLIEPENEASLRLFRALGYVEAEGMHYLSRRDSPDA